MAAALRFASLRSPARNYPEPLPIVPIETKFSTNLLKALFQIMNNRTSNDKNEYVTFMPTLGIRIHCPLQMTTFQLRSDCLSTHFPPPPIPPEPLLSETPFHLVFRVLPMLMNLRNPFVIDLPVRKILCTVLLWLCERIGITRVAPATVLYSLHPFYNPLFPRSLESD